MGKLSILWLFNEDVSCKRYEKRVGNDAFVVEDKTNESIMRLGQDAPETIPAVYKRFFV